MKRRTFLNQLGYGVPASIFLSSFLTSCNKDDDDGVGASKKFKNYKVVVIGAGAAGLYTGWFLKERGFDVTILEASGRIGGRIKSDDQFTDYDIELGAEHIYGSSTIWSSIINETGTSMENIDDRADHFFFKQDPYNLNEPPLKSADQASQYADFLSAKDFINNTSPDSPDISVEAALAQTGLWNMFGVANGLVGNKQGTVNYRLGLKGYREEQSLQVDDDQVFILKENSLKSVLEQKFSSVLDKVELNTPVKSIDYLDEKIVVSSDSGRLWEADRVVVTVPLKILQDKDITFIPELPSTKLDAMQKIGMGAGMKVHLKFSTPFWENIVGNNVGSIYGHNFLPEIFISSIDRSTEPILTCFIMGERAEQFSSMGNTAISVILSHLDDLFAAGNIASQSWIQGGAHIADWTKEPYIRGAISYPVVGGGLIFRKELAAPVAQKLFFAGEATHFEGQSGSVHGAIETGARAAAELEASIE